MKRLFRTVQSRLLTACALLSFIFLIQLSCTKIDTRAKGGIATDATERFFQIPAGTMPEVVRVISYLKAQNRQHNFVNAFVSQQGMPVWNKAILKTAMPTASIGGSGEDTVIVIPFVLNNENLVNGCIKATLNGNISSIAYRRDQYAQLPFAATTTTAPLTAEQYAMQMMYMDKYVFGHSTFKVTDRRLFYFHGSNAADTAATTKIVLKDSSNTGNYNTIENCQTIISFHCTGGGQCDKYTGQCDLCWRCLSWNTFCSLDIGGEPPLGIPLPSGPGGTGGNGGGTPPGNGGGNPAPAPGSGNHGTEPLTDPGIAYNPEQAEEVIVDTSITNNYPCFTKILDTLSAFGTNNLNKTAQRALNTIFGENVYVHITIKLKPSLPPAYMAQADLRQTYTEANDQDHVHYKFDLNINPILLNQGTKEYIAATLTHEAMHAYIDYVFKQYSYGLFSENYVKSRFPIFWFGVPSPISADYHHNLMANQWVQTIANSLNAFTNNEMSQGMKDTVYRALGWGGLEDDSYLFKFVSDSCEIRAINVAAQDKNSNIPVNMPAHPGCGTYNFTAHSLKLKDICD